MARRKASPFDAASKRALAAAQRGNCVGAYRALGKAKKGARVATTMVNELCSCSTKVSTVRRQRGREIKQARPGTTRHTIQQLLYQVPKSKGLRGARARARRRRR